MASAQPLPKFQDPPVIETVLSIEFANLNWNVPHFGLYWDSIREHFPNVRSLPPLPKAEDQSGQFVQFMETPEIRCWFISADDKTLIQVQNDRFVFNWRKGDGGATYPHYEDVIRPRFMDEWSRFCDFVAQLGLGDIKPVNCEVSYVNHLTRGKGWNSTADLNRVFPSWSGKTSGDFLPTPDGVTFSVWYPILDRGRLTVSVKPGLIKNSGEIIQIMSLTARIIPKRDAINTDIGESLDMGREWVVRGFADATSNEMHGIWKRR